MKKFLLTIGLIFPLITMSASECKTIADAYRWSHESVRNGRERSAICLPTIEVIYDSDSQSIKIISSMDCDATVFIYDINGNLIASAVSLDEILSVDGTNNSVFFVRIESDNWYAIATIGV